MKKISLSKNWNLKLDNNYFILIRPIYEIYKINENFILKVNIVEEINKKNELINYNTICKVLKIIEINLNRINDIISYLDSGISSTNLQNKLYNFYKTSKFNILLVCKEKLYNEETTLFRINRNKNIKY